MAKCKYCGEAAESFDGNHPSCEVAFQLGERQIEMEIASAAAASGDIEGLPSRVAIVARDARISEARSREMVLAGWLRAVDKFLEHDVLDEEEERRLIRLQYLFELTHAELDATRDWHSMRANAA